MKHNQSVTKEQADPISAAIIQAMNTIREHKYVPRETMGDSLEEVLRFELAQVTAQRDELLADMRCIAESNGEDAVEFAKHSVAKFDPEMYPRFSKAEQH